MQTKTSEAMLAHYASTHPSYQWRGFLSALAAQLESEFDTAQMRALMARVGRRFAHDHPLPPAATVDALAAAFNAVWASHDWGFVDLAEAADHLRIRHCCAPLAALGAGTGTGAWAPGFLQGAYEQWFEALGARALSVTIAHAASPADLEFHLAR